MKLRVAFSLFSFLFLIACANAPGWDHSMMAAQASIPQQGPASELEAFLRGYDQYFRAGMQTTHTPGAAVVIVKGGRIEFIKGYGLRYPGSKDSIDAETIFRIGSLSKGFAGILTGMLVQDSLLRWDDPVQRYYPQFTLRDKKQAARVQLWHLLSHTCGLPYHAFTNLVERNFSVQRIVEEYFPKAPVSGKEGEFYAYQNVAICVMEEVMRQRTGKSYAELLNGRIFQPAGMTHASCSFEGIHSAPNKTYPLVPISADQWRCDSISTLYYNTLAAGGVNASIADMGQWLLLLLGHKPELISQSTLDRVFYPVVKTDKERGIFPRWLPRSAASYAMGWRVLEDGADTIIYHGGYVNGYKSEVAFNRKDDIGICVLFNEATGLSSDCIPAFFGQWKAVR